MKKAIYDEALNILVDSFSDPQDEDNDCYMFNRSQMNKISKAIRKAQKQEKLLGSYMQLTKLYEEVYTIDLSELIQNQNYYQIKIIKIKRRIKVLEK